MCPVLLPGITTASTRRVVSSWSQVEPHIPLPSDTHSDKNRAYTPGIGGDKASVQNSATFPMLLLKSSKKVVFLSEISSK